MQVHPISNITMGLRVKNTSIVSGEFLKNPEMKDSVIAGLQTNSLYKAFCNSNETKVILNAIKPANTCVAMFDVYYRPVKKGLMGLFSFLTPYKHFSFGGYGKNYEQACEDLKLQLFDSNVGLLDNKLSEIINLGK